MSVLVEHLCQPADGESRSGDAVVVRREHDLLLLGVIDALGHGNRAADVADTAAEHLRTAPLPASAGELMESLHAALRGSRGAAATLLLVDGARLSGCGVGNVEVRAQGAEVPVFLNPGILGQHVRRMRVFDAELHPGARLACFSDGFSSSANFDEVRRHAARDACHLLFQRHRKGHDDASLALLDFEPAAAAARAPTAVGPTARG